MQKIPALAIIYDKCDKCGCHTENLTLHFNKDARWGFGKESFVRLCTKCSEEETALGNKPVNPTRFIGV